MISRMFAERAADITAARGGSGQSVSQSGVCSYVYLAQLRGGNAMIRQVQFAVKVMLNYTEGMADIAITQEFDAETALLSDPERLPAHRHVMVVLSSFTDTATGLPEWNFEADIVNPRTLFVVMPYFPEDLKRVVKLTLRRSRIRRPRSVRIAHQLLLAPPLKGHFIVHRDVKLDNVLLAYPGTEQVNRPSFRVPWRTLTTTLLTSEAAVLTDFGTTLINLSRICFSLLPSAPIMGRLQSASHLAR